MRAIHDGKGSVLLTGDLSPWRVRLSPAEAEAAAVDLIEVAAVAETLHCQVSLARLNFPRLALDPDETRELCDCILHAAHEADVAGARFALVS